MHCHTHPNQNAVGACIVCGKMICAECRVEIGNKLHCKKCVAALAERKSTEIDRLKNRTPVHRHNTDGDSASFMKARPMPVPPPRRPMPKPLPHGPAHKPPHYGRAPFPTKVRKQPKPRARGFTIGMQVLVFFLWLCSALFAWSALLPVMGLFRGSAWFFSDIPLFVFLAVGFYVAGNFLHKRFVHKSPYPLLGGVALMASLLFFGSADFWGERLAAGVVFFLFASVAYAEFLNRRQYIGPPALPVPLPAPPAAASPLDQGRHYLYRLHNLSLTLAGDPIAPNVHRMQTVGKQIVDHIVEHPEQEHKIQRFIEYYFPTALRFVESYVSIKQKPVKSQNMLTSLQTLAGSTARIVEAFEHQLETLFSNKAMDINADIAVLEQMMRQEGIDPGEGMQL